MTRPSLHTRMIVSPSGPIHIGHVALAFVNRCAAEATNGTFVYATRQYTCDLHPGKRHFPALWAEKNMQELCSVLPPTPADELAAKGFDPGIGVSYGADVEDLEHAKAVWHDLHFEDVWGPWPPETPRDEQCRMMSADGNIEYWDKRALIAGQYERGHPHPFITLVRVLVEERLGRNVLIRGADRRVEADLYNAIATRVRGEFGAPWQYFIPHLLRSGERIPQAVKDNWFLSSDFNRWNGYKLASSDPAGTEGFYLKDVIAAGRTAEELFAFLRWAMLPTGVERTIFETGWAWHEECPGLFPAIHNLKAHIVIPDAMWFRFLEHGWGRLF